MCFHHVNPVTGSSFKQAFALLLYMRFPFSLSSSLDATAIVSVAYRPSQTPHLTLSPKRVAGSRAARTANGRRLGGQGKRTTRPQRAGRSPPLDRISKKTMGVVVFHWRLASPTYATPPMSFHRVRLESNSTPENSRSANAR